MHISVSIPLSTGTVSAAQMLADPAYVEAKVQATGALDHQVDVVTGGRGAFTVTTRRSLPVDLVPATFRSFVGPRLDVRQVEAWEPASPDAVRRGTVVVEIAGAPVRLTGTMTLSGTGGSSTLAYEGDIKAQIPLFSAPVEQAAARAIEQVLAVERDVSARWLEDHGKGGAA